VQQATDPEPETYLESSGWCCSKDTLPLLAPLGGAVPFGAPLLGDFSGELAGFGDSAGLGDSA